MPKTFTIGTYDKKHKENLAKRARKVQQLYDAAIKRIAQAAAPSLFDADTKKEFHFEDFPVLKKEMEALMQDLGSSLQANIEDGDQESWTLSNTKNDAMVDSIIGKKHLPKKVVQAWKHPHLEALNAFIARKEAGMNLSRRVWNLTQQFKSEMELALELGMGEGKSAAALSRDIRKYLVEPNKLFRRVRDKSGALRLSKAAAAYHPGQGVYRSSYKNALRMTATENNIAYRTADHNRWQTLPFVIGIEIHISNNHPTEDICDLFDGKRFPKDFKFTGWHPWCRCYAVSVLASQEEMDAYTTAIMNGEDVSHWKFTGQVEKMPKEFNKWMKDNQARIENATSMPYFIKKNDTFVRVDNLSDPGRKGIMQIITVGTAAPYLDILYGLKTDPDNSLKGRLGNLQGIHHRTFGDLDGFGELLQNLYATGDMILRRTGESVDTKFQMLKNQFATRFAQTTYELTNEDNYIHNGTFLAAIGATEDSLTIDGWSIDDSDETAIWILNGAPVMVNGQITTSGNRRILIEETEGRNMLRIINCGVTQDNTLIRQPGTHKEYAKPTDEKTDEDMGITADGFTEVQDTLYINARVYAKTAGTMTIGFSPATEVEGKKNELAAQSVKIAYSGEWQFVKLEGKWNGKGNFVLRYTGDMLVSFLAVTDKPIDNLQKTVSTQIIQTATNIKLLGENIDKVNGKTTQLGIELDAEKKNIRLYVDEQDKALQKDYTSQITITKESILQEVTERDEKLNETLSSSIKTEAGRIDLINSWQTDTETKISSIETSIDEIKLEVSSVTDTANETSAALANLTITVDEINTAVGKAATKDELQNNIDTLSNTISNLRTGEYYEQEGNPWQGWTPGGTEYKHNGAIWKYTGTTDGWLINGHIYRYKCYNDSDANSKYAWEDVTKTENTVTTVIQKQDSWTEAAGRFGADGKLKDTSYLMTTADKNELVSTYFNNDGSIKNTAGLVTTSAYAGLFLQAMQDNGVMTSADMSLYVTKDSGGYITNAKIKADRIVLEGATTINGTFSIDTDGYMQAIGGTIGGFEIGSNHIGTAKKTTSGSGGTDIGYGTEGLMSLYNDSIIFNGKNRQAILGQWATLGTPIMMRITDEVQDMIGRYGAVISVKGSISQNTALEIGGGHVAGFNTKTFVSGFGYVTQTTAPTRLNVNIDRTVGSAYISTEYHWRAKSTDTNGKDVAYETKTRDVYVYLPEMNHYDDGHIIHIKRGINNGNDVYLVPGKSKNLVYKLYANGYNGYYTTETGNTYILYDDNSYATSSDPLKIESEGDAMTFIYFKDLQLRVTKNNITTTYKGCWVQWKNPRTW